MSEEYRNDFENNQEPSAQEPENTGFTMIDPEPEKKEESSFTNDTGNSYYSSKESYHFDSETSDRVKASPFDKPEKKKKSGLAKRAMSLVLSGVLLGGAAGGTMVGVQYAAKSAGLIGSSQSSSTGQTIRVVDNTSTSTAGSGSSSSSIGDVSGIVDSVLPSVVAITNTQTYQNYSNMFGSYFFGYGSDGGTQEVTGSGSGIIIGQNDTELLIVTNYHVIEDADSLTVSFCDDETADTVVKGTDEDNDLAVVAVKLDDISEDTKNAIAIATLHTADDLKVGQGVVAIGNALGYGQSVTVGYISALNRTVSSSDGSSRELLQTDAAINPGNSGGALINMSGEIIGINSAKYSDTDVEGMGFAIPISKVMDIIDDLMTRETKTEVSESERGYLGIRGITVDSSYANAYNIPEGVYVSEIIENGAAADSDLQERDIITKFAGVNIESMEELQTELKYYKIGDQVTLTVQRLIDNSYQDVEITLTLKKQVGSDSSSSSNSSRRNGQ